MVAKKVLEHGSATKRKPANKKTAAPDLAKPILGDIVDIPIKLIDEPSQDVRQFISEEHIVSLAESMQAIGLIHEPLAVKIKGRFEIISGHCRFLAARSLNWTTLRCKVVDQEEVQREFMKLHENLFRQDLTAIEKATALHINKLKFGLTDDDLARQFGHSRPWVTRILGALGWPQDLQEANRDGVLGFEVCDVLRKVADPDHRATLTRYAVADGCSKRLAGQWYDEWLRNKRIMDNLKAREQDTEGSPLVKTTDELARDAYEQQQAALHSRVAAMRKRCNMCGGEHPMDSLLSWDLCEHCVGLLNDIVADAKEKGLLPPGA